MDSNNQIKSTLLISSKSHGRLRFPLHYSLSLLDMTNSSASKHREPLMSPQRNIIQPRNHTHSIYLCRIVNGIRHRHVNHLSTPSVFTICRRVCRRLINE